MPRLGQAQGITMEVRARANASHTGPKPTSDSLVTVRFETEPSGIRTLELRVVFRPASAGGTTPPQTPLKVGCCRSLKQSID